MWTNGHKLTRVLIIDDEEKWFNLIQSALPFYAVDFAKDFEEVQSHITMTEYDIACVNWTFHRPGLGKEVLLYLQRKAPRLPALLITGQLGHMGGSINNFKIKYQNIYDIIIKGDEPPSEESQFLVDLSLMISKRLQETAMYEKSNGSTPMTKPDRKISWLHISDLHIGCKDKNRDWASLKAALISDLERNRSLENPINNDDSRSAGIQFNPDLIFLTGDIAYKGASEEYDEAQILLSDIWRITGLTKHETFMVPGNHDVDRAVCQNDKVFKVAYKSLVDLQDQEEAWLQELREWWNHPAFMQPVHQKFEHYRHFSSEVMDVDASNLFYVTQKNIRGANIEIVGLNSAIMSWQNGEDRERGLWIGRPQIEAIKENSLLYPSPTLRIFLVHHPREALHQLDEASWTYMQRNGQILLHGHLHKMKVLPSYEPEHEHFCLPGGSVHQNGQWSSQRYTYCEYYYDRGELNIYMRKTIPGADPVYTRDIESYPLSNGAICLNVSKLQKF